MTLLINLGCGATRPPAPWVNVDDLHSVLGRIVGTGDPGAVEALKRLRTEENYENHNLAERPWPFKNDSADGIVMSHILEHMDCEAALASLRECLRILKPGGVLRVAVPDVAVFRANHARDSVATAIELFGEPIHEPHKKTFMNYALFMTGHRQALGEDAVWCHLVQAGFPAANVERQPFGTSKCYALAGLDNRQQFTLFMDAVK